MARITGRGRRIGAVRGRSQVLNPRSGLWAKRGRGGRFIDSKSDGAPFRGVRKER